MNYIRHKLLLEVEPVVSAMKEGRTTFHTTMGKVGISSNRMLTYTKGTSCVAIERHRGERRWHLHLYANNVMITSDHILPVALGGGNGLENRQPMEEVIVDEGDGPEAA